MRTIHSQSTWAWWKGNINSFTIVFVSFIGVEIILEAINCEWRGTNDKNPPVFTETSQSGRWVFVLRWHGVGHRSRGCGERTPNSGRAPHPPNKRKEGHVPRIAKKNILLTRYYLKKTRLRRIYFTQIFYFI